MCLGQCGRHERSADKAADRHAATAAAGAALLRRCHVGRGRGAHGSALRAFFAALGGPGLAGAHGHPAGGSRVAAALPKLPPFRGWRVGVPRCWGDTAVPTSRHEARRRPPDLPPHAARDSLRGDADAVALAGCGGCLIARLVAAGVGRGILLERVGKMLGKGSAHCPGLQLGRGARCLRLRRDWRLRLAVPWPQTPPRERTSWMPAPCLERPP
mmetsp:Transcript_30719/g.78267  ORF Transcript_30719/g.78267 Transcript_30719/m.78267 type:complete len:214 (-) Transcript_30719:342-983(-)